ncbi:MAG: glycosyltransferase family 4 protein [Planctomycetaceae bacterium]|nr:glycosyltransferase family 4 protein [Planctomycetaceae bacterium]
MTVSTENEPHPVVVHLPFYDDNPYQTMIMRSQTEQGWTTIQGGGGGNFLRTAIRRWKADIYHFHWLHPYLVRQSRYGTILRAFRFLVEVRILRLTGARIVHTIHNMTNHSKCNTALEQRFARQFMQQCDVLFVHGSAAKQLVLDTFGDHLEHKLHVIPHPNYSCQYPNWSPKRTDAAGSNHLRFGFLGRLARYKCVEQLIEQFKQAGGTKDSLVIRGRCDDPTYYRELAQLASDDNRVTLNEGYVDDEEIPAFFDGIDVCICPSEGILTSGSVLLALTFHTPVIAPHEGCIPEHVGNAGWLYDTECTLADCIATASSSISSIPTLIDFAEQASRRADLELTSSLIINSYNSCVSTLP